MNEERSAITVTPHALEGTIEAPASKSYFQRAIAAALLAEGESVLEGNGLCDDTRAALAVAEGLGARINLANNTVKIHGGISPIRTSVSCGESGLCIRMFSPIAALYPGQVTLTAEGSLTKRPLGILEHPLTILGAHCVTNNGYAPVTVSGPLNGGYAIVDGSVSSQIISGLLMALPCAPKDSHLIVTGLTSRPYVQMTLALVREFGITIHWHKNDTFAIPGGQHYIPCRYRIEGDWSGAAAFLVAGAIAGKVTVKGLNLHSVQADRLIVEILTAAGSEIKTGEESVTAGGGALRPIIADLTDAPDLFPVLTALALTIPGTSRLSGVSRLRYKESDRAAVLMREFAKLGAVLTIEEDTLVITGIDHRPTHPLIIESHGDHRIAMAAAIAALRFGPLTITNASCVTKSYPAFFEDLSKLPA